MAETKVAISNQSKKILDSFKKVVEVILEEEISFPNYIDIVIDKGIKSMIGDIIPKEPDVLWNTIERIIEANPEFFCEFVAEMIKRGELQIGKPLNKSLDSSKNSPDCRK